MSMTKDDFRIHLDEAGDLVIVIEKCCNCDDKDSKECKEKEKECCDEKECKYLRREFSYAKFEQTLVLPDDVDKSHIKAKVKHGVLCIRIPKKMNAPQEKTARVIEIE